MYSYFFLGVSLETNCRIPFLKSNEMENYSKNYECYKKIVAHIEIINDYENEKPYGIRYLSADKVCITFQFVKYILFLKENRMQVYAKTTEIIFYTLFNIPLSFMLSANDIILFHSSACIIDNTICAFTGEKGMGKSTLIKKLMKRGIEIYSDDSIAIINQELECFNSYNFMKIKKDNKNNLGEIDILHYNEITDKYLCPIHATLAKRKIAHIYVLKRGVYRDYTIEEIKQRKEKILALYGGIVGIKFFSSQIKAKVVNGEIFKKIVDNIQFSYLYIPDETIDSNKIEGIITKL